MTIKDKDSLSAIQGGEAVALAWQRWSGDYHEVGYSRLTDDQKGRGWQERPLYTYPADQVAEPSVDDLAAFIREINGDNRMGAGALAERICEWLANQEVVK